MNVLDYLNQCCYEAGERMAFEIIIIVIIIIIIFISQG